MAGAPKRTLNLKAALRALSYRNYRLFFTGQAVSLIGTWMTRMASSWLVYRLTDDPWMLGVVGFASLAPAFLLAPFAGVWVDRSHNLKRLIILTQAAGMLQSIGLVIVAWGPFTPDQIVLGMILLNIYQGLVNSFDIPARQAFLPLMISHPGDLANGVALNSTLFHMARLIGPTLAGLLVALVGEGGCFLADAVSYIGVLMALMAMRMERLAPSKAPKERMGRSIMEGWRYAYRYEPIRTVLTLVAAVSFLGLPYNVLLPVYAREILNGGPSALGFLTGASGLGAMVGALALARRESIRGIGRMIVWAGVLFSVALLAFAYSRNFALSLVLMAGVGFGMIIQSAACNTIVQTIVAPDKRGRVMSLYSMAFMGMAPFGGLAVGYFAGRFTTPPTLAVCALGCALSTAYFAWRLPAIREATLKDPQGLSSDALYSS